jgi:hypothetical protein
VQSSADNIIKETYKERAATLRTASLLAGFTPDGKRDSQLYVYERNTERAFRLPPDKAAKRRNYYSIPKQDGGFDDRVDVMLTKLEEQASPGLKKLLARNYDLTVFERALIAYLIAFQEFRTPWARAMFQQMEVSMMEQLMHVSARTPGYIERVLSELKAKGEVDHSVTPDELRDALENDGIRLRALPHMGIDTMVSMGQTIGNIYTGMRWTILLAQNGAAFLTSDAPVVRRNPDYRCGMSGGGLMASTAEVWFPLSKELCLQITHDVARVDKFNELLENGKLQEAEQLRRDLPPILEAQINADMINSVNIQTIHTADRLVFSPFESAEIPALFKCESQNMRIVTSSPIMQPGKRITRPNQD